MGKLKDDGLPEKEEPAWANVKKTLKKARKSRAFKELLKEQLKKRKG